MRMNVTAVFNAEATIEQFVMHLVQVVDRIVIIEGAAGPMIDMSRNGRSTDQTNDILDDLKSRLQDKLIVIRGNSGYPTRTDMYRRAEPLLESGFLMQMDSDEFLPTKPLAEFFKWLEQQPYDQIEFWGYHFFGTPEWHMPVIDRVFGNMHPYRRILKITKGDSWEDHFPPGMKRPRGFRPTICGRDQTREMGLMVHHYGYITREQVSRKMLEHAGDPYIMRQFEKVIRGDTDVDIGGHRLERFAGKHPVNIQTFRF